MISVVLPNLQGGGAEKVAINLANTWASWGFLVEFVLMERRGEFLDLVDSRVKIHDLNCQRIRQVPVALWGYLRRRRPDITLVNMWPLTSVATLSWWLAGVPGKLFLCEHVGLSYYFKSNLSITVVIARWLLHISHSHVSGLVTVSAGAGLDLSQMARLPKKKISVIYNPVVRVNPRKRYHSLEMSVRSSLWGGRFRIYMLSVGNLSEVKNHRLLLRAFSRIFGDLEAGLVILGEGGLRSVLEQDIHDLGLSGKVLMPGFQADPSRWYAAADLFLLSSNFEGFGNVIVEALAYGIPIVSTDCPHGPAEILEYGRYGELVPVHNDEDFASGIRRAVLRQWDRQSLQRRALEFSIPKQAQAYLNLFNTS